MNCPMCGGGIDADPGSTLDFDTMVARAHNILHEPPPYSDMALIRRDLAGILVALALKIATPAPGPAEDPKR